MPYKAIPQEVQDAIDRILAEAPDDEFFALDALHARIDYGDICIEMRYRHKGLLAEMIEEDRSAFLPPQEQHVEPEGEIRRLLNVIRQSHAERTGYENIGHFRLLLDPFLQRLLEEDRETALDVINRAEHPSDDEANSDAYRAYQKFSGAGDIHIQGIVRITDTIMWHGYSGELIVENPLPQSVASSLAGRPLASLIEHPLVPDDLTILSVAPYDVDIGIVLALGKTDEAEAASPHWREISTLTR